MRIGLIRVAAVAAICFGVGMYQAAAAPPRHASKKQAEPVVVKTVGDQLTFDPPRIVIRRGQTVEWENQSRQVHDVVDDASKALNKADVGLPAGATPFDSGYVNPGQNYTHRFTVRGTYHYVCSLHEAQGMKGEIVVK